MTSKKSKKRKFTPRDFLESSPRNNSNSMPSSFGSSPPQRPHADVNKFHTYSSMASGAPRRENTGDYLERYPPRSRSPRYDRERSPGRRDPRSRSNDDWRSENNYRPVYESRPPSRERLYSPVKPRVPLEDRASSTTYNSLSEHSHPSAPKRVQAPEKSFKEQNLESSVTKPKPKPKPNLAANVKKVPENTKTHTVNTETAPQPLPSTNPTPNHTNDETQAAMVKDLGDRLLDLLDQCTDLSALKSQEHAEKQKLKRRQAEFEKFKTHHEKFPSTKASQTSAKDDAAKAYKSALEMVELKKVSLIESVRSVAARVGPNILAGSRGNQDLSKHEQRFAALENTCNGFPKLFEEQKKLLLQQQMMNQRLEGRHQESEKSYRELESKHSTLAKDYANERSAWQDEIRKLKAEDQFNSKNVAKLESSVELVTTEISRIKKDSASSTEIRNKNQATTDQRLAEVEGLAKRVPDISKMLSRLTKLESSTVSQQEFDSRIIDLNNKWTKADKTCQTTLGSLKKHGESQSALERKVTNVESAISGRNLVDKADFDTLLERVQKVEETSRAHMPLSSAASDVGPRSSQLLALQSRTDEIDSTRKNTHDYPDVNSINIRLTKLETNQPSNGSELESIARRLADLEKTSFQLSSPKASELESLDRRLSAVEQRPAVPTAVATSLSTGASPDIVARLASVENELEILRGSLEVLSDQTGDIVDQAIESQTSSMKRQQKEDVDKQQGSIDALRNDFNSLAQKLSQANQIVAHITATLTNETIQAIDSRGIFARSDRVDQIQMAVSAASLAIEIHETALGNLQSRVDNINTFELHQSIANQVLGNLPNLANFEARMNGFQTSISVFQTAERKMADLEDLVSQASQRVQSMRNEIDTLVIDLASTKSTSKKAGEELKALQDAMKKDQNTLAELFSALITDVNDIKHKAEKVETERTEKDQKEKLAQSSALALAPASAPSTAARPQPANRYVSPSGSFSNVSRAGPSNPRARSKSSNAGSVKRPPSVVSDQAVSDTGASETSKKRAFKETNGSSKLNGSTESPATKKARRRYNINASPVEDDPENDPDFDPDDGNLVEPQISDSESDEPAQRNRVVDLVSDSE